jgi:hypothetical protein
MSVLRKVSFEVEDCWDTQAFRNFIKVLLSDEEAYEVFIISTQDTDRITHVGNSLGLDAAHTIVCSDNDAKLIAIDDNDIDIHLDNIQRVVERVDTETEAVGVLVDESWSGFYSEPMYLVKFDVALSYLNDRDSGGTE